MGPVLKSILGRIMASHNAGDLGLIPESGRSPGEGNGYPFQYSCLENSMDRGAYRATVHGSQRVRHDEQLTVSLYFISCVYTGDPNLGPKSFSMTPLVTCSLPSTTKASANTGTRTFTGKVGAFGYNGGDALQAAAS